MFAEKCKLEGRSGVKRLESAGPYVVIANRILDEAGKSSRFAVVNEREAWVDSVHSTPSRAMSTAVELSRR
jgi:hypothetical protein